MRLAGFALFSSLLVLAARAYAQDAHAYQPEHRPAPTPTPQAQPPEMQMQHGEHAGHAMEAPSEGANRSDPDPMSMMETMPATDRWSGMVHGYAFLTGTRAGGPSGDRDFSSQNHLMLVGLHALGGGKLSLLGTFTLEPGTIQPRGSVELFQRGETYQGALLIDRQHPHDLFVQLAATWERELGPLFKLRLYGGPVGEPAIGPVAYPHRLSASENPTAPLAHHNQDSTHISYDVLTAGVTASIVTLEGSVFHGAEPDENRWNIEAGALDSYSGRLWIRPAPGLSLQASVAHLEHPEAIEEGNQTRATASATYQRALKDGFVALTAISGRNQTPEGPEWGHTLEGTVKFVGKNFVFGRLERVDRDLYELVNKRQRPEGVPRVRTSVDAGTLGAVRELGLLREAETGVGADVTVYRFDSRLDPVYGRHPVSVHVFFRVRFQTHVGMSGMDHGQMGHGGMEHH